MLIVTSLYFFLLVLKQANAVVVVTILMIPMQNCVPDVVKNLNIKVFNLMSRTNETRHIKWHETCKCKCRLDPSVCNNRQRWNEDKCRCECKELLDEGVYVINDLFGILVTVSVNVINFVILMSI